MSVVWRMGLLWSMFFGRFLRDEQGNAEGAGSGGAVAGAVVVIAGLLLAAGTLSPTLIDAGQQAADCIVGNCGESKSVEQSQPVECIGLNCANDPPELLPPSPAHQNVTKPPQFHCMALGCSGSPADPLD